MINIISIENHIMHTYNTILNYSYYMGSYFHSNISPTVDVMELRASLEAEALHRDLNKFEMGNHQLWEV